jgi:hypothetical protein
VQITHFDSAATSDDLPILYRTLHHHHRVMQTPFHFFDKLFGATAEEHRAGFSFGTLFKDVVSLAADLSLLELATGTKVFAADIRGRRLY